MEKNSIQNLEQELTRIKQEIEKRKRDAEPEAESAEQNEKITLSALKAHIEENPAESLAPKYRIKEEIFKKHISDLEPEEDDRKISELLEIAKEKGIINAVHIAENLKNPHILDDFHRRLVYYINFELEKNSKNEGGFSLNYFAAATFIAVIIVLAIIVLMVL